MFTTSGVGVKTAATMAIIKMAYRRYLANILYPHNPTLQAKVMNNGN